MTDEDKRKDAKARNRKRKAADTPSSDGGAKKPVRKRATAAAEPVGDAYVKRASELGTLIAEHPTPELAYAEAGVHSAMAVLVARAVQHGKPFMCCECPSNPEETMCLLYTLAPNGRYQLSTKIPRAQAELYNSCG